MVQKTFQALLIGAVGLGMGIGIGTALRSSGPDQTSVEGAPVHGADLGSRSAGQREGRSDQRVRQLEARIAALETQAAANGDPRGRPSTGSDTASPEQFDPQAAKLQRIKERDNALRAHADERNDPAWSPAAAESIADDLSEISDRSLATVRSVDCRSTSCVASLAWDSYAAATARYRAVLHGPYKLKCATSILLDDPADPSAPYESKLVFDCGDSRGDPTHEVN